MRPLTARRTIRALKRALRHSVNAHRACRARFTRPVVASSSNSISRPAASAVQERMQNVPGLLLNLLKKFLELNQYIAPVYDLRDIGPVGLTSSYVIISSTTSLLALSRSVPNLARASTWEAEADGDIPLTTLAPLRRVSSAAPSDPFRDSISSPRSSTSA
ncbi:hypothetical protein GL218_05912 [Daldinia childiae]|uniref:uncharacterized protein n=1 Tax=Daldinia childiae TaxID=326645 RepID=UPI001446DAF8|nr:uncharacterized protein GL218_05912 [Daldinia childiae]KAF3058131.1 hypothetical protein GL218_05912 [Daldinia childiae]